MQNRIYYDGHELIRISERVLDELKILQYDPRYRQLLGNSLIDKMAKWDKNIRTRKDDPFTLVVCGEFKRGKSSLINALLGESVVTTNVTTETVTLNQIVYGPHSNEAILSGGRRMSLSDDELKKSKLEDLIRKSSEPITQLRLQRPIEFLRNMTIIDTPGLNDSLKNFNPMVEHALQQADAVVYVCSVSYPLSLTEQLFLRTMVLPQKHTDLFIVGNFGDTIPGEELQEFQKFMDSRICEMIPGYSVSIVSALDEMCRLWNTARPNKELADTLAANFDEFKRKLESLIEEKKDMLLPDRIHRLTCGMEQALSSELDAIEKGIQLDSQRAQEQFQAFMDKQMRESEKQAEIQDEIRNDIVHMREEASAWTGEFLDRMCNEVEQLDDMPSEDLTKYYSVFCVDTIQEAINRCLDFHINQIYDRLDNISTDTKYGKYGIRLPDGSWSYGFRFALDNKTWTMGDNVGYVASKFSQLGLLSLVVDGIAGAMRQKETENRTPAILQSIRKQYPAFRKSAQDTIASTYEQLSETVLSQLTEFFGERRNEENALQDQVVRVAKETEKNKDEIQDAVNRLKTVLSRLHEAEEI